MITTKESLDYQLGTTAFHITDKHHPSLVLTVLELFLLLFTHIVRCLLLLAGDFRDTEIDELLPMYEASKGAPLAFFVGTFEPDIFNRIRK